MTNQHVGRDEILWRRIHSAHFVDGRISTAAFKDPEMSVDIARLRRYMSLTLENGVGVASFCSAVAYDNGQLVSSNPLEDNQAHALVIGNKPRRVSLEFCNSSTFTSRETIRLFVVGIVTRDR